VVEAKKHTGDDEATLWNIGAGCGQWHSALELRDVVVAEIADDRPAERFGLLERNDALAAPDERVAAESSLIDRLEEKRRTRGLAQAEIGRERCQEVDVELSRRHRKAKRPSSGRRSSGAGCRRFRLGAQAPAPLVAPRPPGRSREDHPPRRV
jgi:hypothetical protein